MVSSEGGERRKRVRKPCLSSEGETPVSKEIIAEGFRKTSNKERGIMMLEG